MDSAKRFYVYILANKPHGTLYVGVTSDLVKRVWQHKAEEVEGFTRKYAIHQLVYFEEQADAENAILREKKLKRWKREWKIALIEEANGKWRDLYEDICKP